VPSFIDLERSELLQTSIRGKWSTLDRRFQVVRRQNRGWQLLDSKDRHAVVPTCDSREAAQVEIVKRLVTEQLTPIAAALHTHDLDEASNRIDKLIRELATPRPTAVGRSA
jgi:hypothetical protein